MPQRPALLVLLQSLVDGEVSFPEAVEMARDPDIANSATLKMVEALSGQFLRQANTPSWQTPIEALYVMRQAVASREDPLAKQLQAAATLGWIEAVKGAVLNVPDPGLFWSACDAGRALRRQARRDGDAALYADVAFRLGILHLDPYSAMRTRDNYELTLVAWAERLRYVGGPSWFEQTERPMPSAETAFRLAASYLSRAATGVEGGTRGRVLKALLQARDWLAFVRQTPSPPDDELASEALGLLLPEEDAQAVVGLFTDRTLAGHPFSPATLERTIAQMKSPGGGPVAAQLDSLVRLAVLVFDAQPETALAMLRDAGPLFDDRAGDVLVGTRLQTLVSLLITRAQARGARESLTDAPIANQARDWLDQCERLAHEPSIAIGGMLALAEQSKQPSREHEAIAVLEPWIREHHGDLAAYADVGKYELASLWQGMGVNAVGSESWAESATSYAKAAEGFLSVGLTGAASDSVERAFDVGRRDGQASIAAVVALAPLADEIRRRLGSGIRHVLGAVAETAVRLAPPQRTNGDLLPLLRQLTQ